MGDFGIFSGVLESSLNWRMLEGREQEQLFSDLSLIRKSDIGHNLVWVGSEVLPLMLFDF